MKRNITFTFLILFLINIFYSCKKCKELFCEEGFFDLKTCQCVCENDFEGKFCNQKVVQKFVGEWQAKDKCTGAKNKNIDYTAKISLTKSKNLIVNNFLSQQNINLPLQLNKTEKNFIQLNKIILGNNITLSNGSATINEQHNQLLWQYCFEQLGSMHNCTAIWDKIN